MRSLEGAKCAGKWGLFDCHIIAAHVEARKLCDDCPVKEACHSLLVEVMTDCSAGPAGAPSGTWAGRLYKQGRRVRVPKGYTQEPTRVGEVLPDVIAHIQSHSPQPDSEAS